MPNTSFIAHPYASFLHEIEKPARYIGGEWGSIQKDWDTTSIRICLAFPDLYDLGMSHLGTRILYDVLNQPGDVLCERAFVPWHDLEERLRKQGAPLVSLENARPLCDFDVIGISLQHELVFTNVLTLLDLGGIPLRSEHRGNDDPLVLGGGSVASHPEPVAPFFDAFVVGDGEQKALEVARTWAQGKRDGLDRGQRLRKLAALGGVYVPSLYEREVDEASHRMVVTRSKADEAPMPVTRAFVENLDAFPFPAAFPTGGPEAVFDRLSVELARGCSQGCRFCQAGMIFRPERERRPGDVIDSIRKSIEHSGQDEISLTSLSPADYSTIGPLVRLVSEQSGLENVAMTVSSLRAYGLDDATLDDIRRVRASNLTFAPEAGTQRLRDVINKNVTEEQLLGTVERVVTRGWERIKLYFMIGLPTETMDDIDGILELTAQCQNVARRVRRKGRPTQVTASASTFVPKPHSPFQWAAMDVLASVQDKHRRLSQGARDRRVEIKMHESHGSVLEGVLARGDSRLADVIEAAWRAGARFDAWDGQVRWDAWTDAMAAHDVDVATYLREIPVDAPLAWGHIDMGVEPAFLRKEYDRALRERSSPPCLRPVERRADDDAPAEPPRSKLVCYQCGADCDLHDVERRRAEAAEQVVTLRVPKVERGVLAQPFRYRFRFEKRGRAALLGHLDLVREVPRILRRSGMKLWYSKGFHPKPSMAFGPALSLGVPSFEEWVDIKTAAAIDVDTAVDAINAVCPDGLRFASATLLDPGAKGITNELVETTMLVGLSPDAIAQAGGASWLSDRIAHVLSREALPVSRTSKGRERTVDIRPFLLKVSVGDDTHAEVLARAGLPGAWVPILVDLALSPNGTARLDELVEVLMERAEVPYRAARLSFRT